MEYNKIIENILGDSELIAQCKNTLANIEAKGESATELIHVARYLSLDKINYKTRANASDNFKEILSELDSLTNTGNSDDTNANDNANDDTVVSLQLSSILDSVLQKLSNNDKKIYIYRYFYVHPTDTISSLCGRSASSVTKALSTANSIFKDELHNANIQCSVKTLLKSFADIDMNYLNTTITGNSTDNTDIHKSSIPSSKKNPTSWKKLLYLSFAALFAISIIANLYLITDGFAPRTKPVNGNDDASEETIAPYTEIITYKNGKETIDIDALLNYKVSENYSSGAVSYESKNFVGIYSSLSLDDTIPLDDCVGEEIPEMQHASNQYYKLKGLNSVQYIIQKSYDTYRLYYLTNIFQRADLTETPIDTSYFEILYDFYGLESDEDIECITVSNAYLFTGFDDNYVKKLIDDPNDISQILYILNNCKYNDASNNPESNVPQINNSNFSTDYLLNTSVKLAIKKKDGTIIEGIYYRPDYHYFYNISNYSFSITEDSSESLGKYLDNMLDLTQHDREPIDPANWNLDIQIDSMHLSELHLTFMQKGTPINGLYIGQDFTIEKYDDGKWVELPTHSVYDKNTTSKFYTSIACHNGHSGYSCSISKKYSGTPDIGKYRFTFTVYDSFSKDLNNPVSRIYTVEYEKTS